MPDNSNEFMKNKEREQRRLVAAKKMQQGTVSAPQYKAPDTTPKTFAEKCSHFWFYYKIHTISAILLFAAIASLVAQCINKPKYDYTVLLSCHSEISDAQADIIGKNLAKYGKDVNKDGKVLVNVINCAYVKTSDYSTQTVKDARLQTSMTDSSVILYMTDEKAFERMIDLTEETSFFVDIGLPEMDGRAVALDRDFLLNNGKEMGVSKQLQLYLSRRAVKGTLIEKDKDTKENVEKAEELLYNIMNK